MQSTSEYLEVSRGVSEYLRDLDLANEWRLTQRWVQVWIVESSSVWGDIRSVVEMECVRNLETRIFRRRGWNSGVSPNSSWIEGAIIFVFILISCYVHLYRPVYEDQASSVCRSMSCMMTVFGCLAIGTYYCVFIGFVT